MNAKSNSRFNPLNWPDHLRQRRQRSEDGEESARDIQNPHVWEDPDSSMRERLTPDTVAQWMVVGVAMLVGSGLILYLYPVFGSTFRNPFALGGFLFLGYSLLLYLKGRQDGIRAYIDLAKSVIYYGDDVDIRLGEYQGEKGNRELFTPLVNLSYGGFNSRELKKRDLPYDASKLRSNRGDDAGEEPVVDRLNATTVKRTTENFGTVLFTHADDLEHDEFGRYSDRYTSMPTELDEDVVEDVNSLIDSLEHNIKTRQDKIEMYEQSNADLRQLKQEQVNPQVKEQLQLLAMLRGIINPNNQDRSKNVGQLDFEDTFDQLYDEQVDA